MSLGNWEPSTWAAAIGAGGSLAYSAALFFGFVQSDAVFKKIWPTRLSKTQWQSLVRIFFFVLIGGVVSFIFQLPETKLAPIQAFIVGMTWPSIVAQTLAGRQGDSPKTIRDQINELLGAPQTPEK